MNSHVQSEQREQLQSLMADRFGDPELASELRKLAKEMDFLNPQGNRYNFGGNEDIDLDAAMQLMNEMHKLDELIDQLQTAERGGDLDHIDQDLLQRASWRRRRRSRGRRSAKSSSTRSQEAGYIRPTGR